MWGTKAMTKVLHAALLTMVLAGCATQSIETRMTAYVGQPVSVVINKLGFPTAEQTIAGVKVYVWRTYRLVEGSSRDCTIRAIVDAHDIITRWDLDGNQSGCMNYALMLG
jgi:hypothetical protein